MMIKSLDGIYRFLNKWYEKEPLLIRERERICNFELGFISFSDWFEFPNVSTIKVNKIMFSGYSSDKMSVLFDMYIDGDFLCPSFSNCLYDVSKKIIHKPKIYFFDNKRKGIILNEIRNIYKDILEDVLNSISLLGNNYQNLLNAFHNGPY